MVLEQAESRVPDSDRQVAVLLKELCNWYSRLKVMRREAQLAVHSLVVERRERFERTQLGQEGDY